jgi:hyperosmotically inducible protein
MCIGTPKSAHFTRVGLTILAAQLQQERFMTKTKHLRTALLCILCVSSGFALQEPAKPDNTATNKRDRVPGAATADKQKMNAGDRTLTAKIRRAVIADKTISTNGHNVKIISQNGVVTLKGPVKSTDEVNNIVGKATAVTGDPSKVVNEMSVAQ